MVVLEIPTDLELKKAGICPALFSRFKSVSTPNTSSDSTPETSESFNKPLKVSPDTGWNSYDTEPLNHEAPDARSTPKLDKSKPISSNDLNETPVPSSYKIPKISRSQDSSSCTKVEIAKQSLKRPANELVQKSPEAVKPSAAKKCAPSEVKKVKLPKRESPRRDEDEKEGKTVTESKLKVKLPVRQSKAYNLRSAEARKSRRSNILAPRRLEINKRHKDSFRDVLLTEVNIQTYHSLKDESGQKVIDLVNKSQKSQVDRFVYQSKSFIVITWLTAARIFEYNPKASSYVEVKRIPNRYIQISPNLITSVHYCDSKFYLAYLWGSNEDKVEKTRPYIEIRDICGKLISPRHYLDHVVKSIHSDREFIYVKSNMNIMYVHRKDLFNRIYYTIDFSSIAYDPLITAWIESPTHQSFTRLPLIAATPVELLVTEFDIFSHTIRYCFKFEDTLKIVSIDKYEHYYIIHRNLSTTQDNDEIDCLSKIDIGAIRASEDLDSYSFTHAYSLCFSYSIIQVRIHGDALYLLGHSLDTDGNDRYEIGCICLRSFKPLWIANLDTIGCHSQILVHDDNVAIVGDCQRIVSVKVDTKEKAICEQCQLSFARKDDKLNHDHNRNVFAKYILLNKECP